MTIDLSESSASRRSFLEQVAGIGTAAMLGESAPRTNSEWDVSWMETVRKAKRVSAEKPAQGYGSLENLQARDAIFLICDFALEHLANRLAIAAGGKADDVHAELRANLVRGAVLVPSGIFGAMEAQNAGCAFFPG